MAAAQYYSSQGFGEAVTNDNVPLLPVPSAGTSAPSHYAQEQLQHQHAPHGPPLHTAQNMLPTSATAHQTNYAYHHTMNEMQNLPSINSADASRTPKLKKYIRFFLVLGFISLGVSNILNGLMFGLMIFTYGTFMRTKNTIIKAKQAWPQDAKTWPTIMLLTIAGITLLASAAGLISKCICIRRRASWKLVLLGYALHIGSWIIVTFLYRYEKGLHGTNNDLWGWSCGDSAKEFQNDLHANIDFSLLCKIQSNSWVLSIIETIAKVIIAGWHFSMKRKVDRLAGGNLADDLGDVVLSTVQNIF
ncbi:MAG: hypothetical protein Q9160_004242 [Pyrenula sp. 1 TL-2023]